MKTRFKRFLGIICLLMLLGPVFSDAKCKCGNPKEKHAEKVYLNPANISFSQNEILVTIEDQVMPAVAVYSDDQGIFVLCKKREGRCPEGYWECSTCSGCTPWHSPDCDWCGYD